VQPSVGDRHAARDADPRSVPDVGPAAHVAAALHTVPRAAFLPPEQQCWAHLDQPLPIGAGATNSQPTTVRTMLELLDPRPGQRVLDVGAGSGWTTALLAQLVGPDGWVLGLELNPDLAAWGAANLAAYQQSLAAKPGPGAGASDRGAGPATLERADPAVLGRPSAAPYDRILVSAMATRLPEALVVQLAPDGILVCPVAGRMATVRRVPGRADPDVSWHGHYRFVPLVTPPEP
jgi:protein-L-isoaspartate(D-aspartate) O-methyltransferase